MDLRTYRVEIDLDSLHGDWSARQYLAALIFIEEELKRIAEPGCTETISCGKLHHLLAGVYNCFGHNPSSKQMQEHVQNLIAEWLTIGLASIEEAVRNCSGDSINTFSFWNVADTMRPPGLRMGLSTVSAFRDNTGRRRKEFLFRYLDVLQLVRKKGKNMTPNMVSAIWSTYGEGSPEAAWLFRKYGIKKSEQWSNPADLAAQASRKKSR